MDKMRTGYCSRCKAVIVWCTSENGKALALDASPDSAGNVFVSLIGARITGIVRSKRNPNPPGTCYMPHAATCPVKTPRRTP